MLKKKKELAWLCKQSFCKSLIPLISQITAEKNHSKISAQIRVICGRRFSLIPLISQITAEKNNSKISAQIRVICGRKFYFIPLISQIMQRKSFKDFCANPLQSAGEDFF
jgi:hypothetical protein